MQLGRKIRDLRLRRGLTVQQLADASGLSKGFISQVYTIAQPGHLRQASASCPSPSVVARLLLSHTLPTLHILSES